MGRRLLVLGAAAAVAAAALALGGALRNEGAAASPVDGAGALERLQAGFAAGDTERLIARLEGRRDPRSLTLLGLAFQQRARETGDPSFYPRAQAALRQALAAAPGDAETLSGLAAVALSQHRFRDALAFARRAVAATPGTARHHGALGDALVELGRYREAFAAFDRMAALRPGLAAYARVSYARELRGDLRGAVAAMGLAAAVAAGRPEPAAWTRTQLGKLYFGAGRLARAGREFRHALAVFPGYAPALDALARVEASQGDLRHAIALARKASERAPLPETVGLLGDLYTAAGDPRRAEEQYRLVRAIDRLLRSNGVRTDLELALFDLDHGLRLRRALARAREARELRPSVFADDVLAWALARNGRCAAARIHSDRALRLGTRDALMFFHRGMIERCLGNRGEARRWFRRALGVNPHFSLLWSPVAEREAR